MAGSANRISCAGHPGRGAETRYELRMRPDHPIGAGQPEVPHFAMCAGCVLDQLSWQRARRRCHANHMTAVTVAGRFA